MLQNHLGDSCTAIGNGPVIHSKTGTVTPRVRGPLGVYQLTCKQVDRRGPPCHLRSEGGKRSDEDTKS